ncbi:hypothetical protein [Brevibacillus dissolubilis]|uniref:hypothetical protein n=1 Tax=Brevibacillus dissolubilis TaxID=1844116 RepID=UPI00111637CE|nr:hypothetical protein [Brevibacillus dissolubilis]
MNMSHSIRPVAPPDHVTFALSSTEKLRGIQLTFPYKLLGTERKDEIYLLVRQEHGGKLQMLLHSVGCAYQIVS